MVTISSEANVTGKNGIAFFDLDHTITSTISGKELVREAFKKNLMTHADLARAIYLTLLYKLNLKDSHKIINDMTTWVAGIPEQTLADLSSEVFFNTLWPSVYEQARGEIEIHKGKNAKVVILSSSIKYICNEVAKNLKMDDIICSELEVKNGYLTGASRLCFGEEKAARLEEYCKKNSAIISDTWYYGDSISDLPALRCVGNPVCVNPDKKLKQEANKRGWKIVQWNH
jgi:HAD superfamily hydrolase (TIGR01490 family)